jgi:uncharacterized protein
MDMNIPLMVYGFGTFQTLVNSFIEEYVWRWFMLVGSITAFIA